MYADRVAAECLFKGFVQRRQMSFPPHQRHTYTRDGKVYDAVNREMSVIVPDESVIDTDRKLLCWAADTGSVKSTVNEVYELVQAHASGFGTAS